MKQKLRAFFDSSGFNRTIVTIIVINSVLIGLETSPKIMENFGLYIDQIDFIILCIFVIEILLKIYAYGKDFYKSAWNIFDASVIIVSILPAAGSFAVFRALRILRTLRLLNNVPKLKLIIESLLLAVPSIGWIMVLLIIIFYVFAVIGTALFGVDFPEYFGTLGRSFYTLFQIMTLESWSSAIARPIQETSPLSALYFVTFILIATYTTLNIFIAIVVNTMNELHHRDLQAEEEHIKSFIESENKKVLKKFETMQDQLKEELKNEIRNIYEKDTTPK